MHETYTFKTLAADMDYLLNKYHNINEKYPIEGAYKGVQETYLMALLCAGVEGVDSIIEK